MTNKPYIKCGLSVLFGFVFGVSLTLVVAEENYQQELTQLSKANPSAWCDVLLAIEDEDLSLQMYKRDSTMAFCYLWKTMENSKQ